MLARFIGSILVSDLKTIEQERLLERRQQEALTDKLTGLFNRRGWEQHVASEEARARRYGNPTSVLIVDLDGLKQVNDTQGHAQGDSLIRNAAQCLRSAVRESDIVARIGGDEFAILAIDCDKAGSEALFRKIVETLSSNGIEASVGSAMRDPQLGLLEAIAEADRAMYAMKTELRAKKSGSRFTHEISVIEHNDL